MGIEISENEEVNLVKTFLTVLVKEYNDSSTNEDSLSQQKRFERIKKFLTSEYLVMGMVSFLAAVAVALIAENNLPISSSRDFSTVPLYPEAIEVVDQSSLEKLQIESNAFDSVKTDNPSEQKIKKSARVKKKIPKKRIPLSQRTQTINGLKKKDTKNRNYSDQSTISEESISNQKIRHQMKVRIKVN